MTGRKEIAKLNSKMTTPFQKNSCMRCHSDNVNYIYTVLTSHDIHPVVEFVEYTSTRSKSGVLHTGTDPYFVNRALVAVNRISHKNAYLCDWGQMQVSCTDWQIVCAGVVCTLLLNAINEAFTQLSRHST